MKSLFGLEGKRILVLGGGQGMGAATVRLLADQGCEIAIADREGHRAEAIAAEIGTRAKTLSLEVDVLDDKALIAAIADVEHKLGPLDGMASVIGMAAWAPLAELEMDTWDSDHRRNLRYFFLAAREVGKSLLKRGVPGSIVGVSSVDGTLSAPYHASYGAAKAGLSNLVKTMAYEWGPHGIRANIVAPGGIITPRIPHLGAAEAAMTDRIPMRRRGEVEEIAKAILFLLSDMASYVSGQTLAVDGGLIAQYPLDLLPPPTRGGTLGETRGGA